MPLTRVIPEKVSVMETSRRGEVEVDQFIQSKVRLYWVPLVEAKSW